MCFLRRRAVCWSIPSSPCMRLSAERSSSCGNGCIPTSRRQQEPSPPRQVSTKESMSFQPRRLKYPTQKSARSESRSVSCSTGRRDMAILSKILGIRSLPPHGRNFRLYFRRDVLSISQFGVDRKSYDAHSPIYDLREKHLSLVQAARLAGMNRLDFLVALSAGRTPTFDLSAEDAVTEMTA